MWLEFKLKFDFILQNHCLLVHHNDVEAAGHGATLDLMRWKCMLHLWPLHVSVCYSEMPEFQHIMFSSRAEVLPGERECHWVYHKNHLVPSFANGFLFWEKGKKHMVKF